jgi:N-methylhydantoinase A
LPTLAGFQRSLQQLLPDALRVDLFHSAGGMIGLEIAARQPIALAMSGPAAGVEAASQVARELNLAQAISFDMGGTTTDVCLLSKGKPALATQMEVGRWMVRQPMVAVQSIGAGGGSIVKLDQGRLAIGPESAGATPGPACYGRGGKQATLTDAIAILGYLEGTARLSRQLKIDMALARGALGPIAQAIGCSVEAAALGIVQVANAAATRALRRITVDRGIDLRDCALIAFGGAGPMFAASLATSVGVDRVIIPDCSGALSALGCLLAKRSFTLQRTMRLRSDRPDADIYARHCSEVEQEIGREIGKSASTAVAYSHTALMRYVGQSYAIEVPCAPTLSRERLTADFHQRHRELYGFATQDTWEIEALRVRGELPASERWQTSAARSHEPALLGRVQCWFEPAQAISTDLYRRSSLSVGHALMGPALIVDELSTIVVPPNWSIRATASGHLEMAAYRSP